MLDELIQNAAKLMREQAAAYRRLDSACHQLAAALVSGQPETIESLTRAGEGELLKMRYRNLQKARDVLNDDQRSKVRAFRRQQDQDKAEQRRQ